MTEDIVAMARAAEKDERLSDGALYGKLADEIERLRAALEVCASDWISAPGTVMGAAQDLSAEFRRRMKVAYVALKTAERNIP